MMSNENNKRLLVVGAGGFIGGFIAAEGLRRGYDVTVTVRESTSRRYLTDGRLKFMVLDYDDTSSLTGALKDSGPWDFIIYNLGATKCVNFIDFNRINYEYLRRFTTALENAGRVPHKFLYVSSLSALGSGDEKNYSPMTGNMIPKPNTRYGLSKIKAETWIETREGLPWLIFRPTGVYGPHEQDYLMMIKSIDSHWDFGVGFRRQMLTFIYVDDLVEAMFMALESDALHKKYIISEPRSYSQREFRRIVAEELGGRVVIPVRLPLWVVYVASVVAEKIGTFRGKPSTLNRDKFKIMKQRNWQCDTSDAERDFGFRARHSLRDGIKATVAAYLAEKNKK